MTTIALFGAAGKMGTRISNRLREALEYHTLYVEAGEAGLSRLRERGDVATPLEDATRQADVAILATPDTLIGKVASEVVPALRSGAMVIYLDPAAPYSGELPVRPGVTYFVTHPCHPPIISDESDPQVRSDFFGGILAKQHIICALMQGPEDDYARGERVARCIFAPVMNAYRVTVEQMAILEPALSETLMLTCMCIIREALNEAVRRGVPADAAREFLLGHMNISIGILFGFLDAQFSAGAQLAVQRAKQVIFQPDWARVFEPENVLEQVRAITQGQKQA